MDQEAFHSIEVAEGLNKSLLEAKKLGAFRGIKVGTKLFLSHLLFVDDILLFCNGLQKDAKNLREVLDLYCLANGMQDQCRKVLYGGWKRKQSSIYAIFSFSQVECHQGIKY